MVSLNGLLRRLNCSLEVVGSMLKDGTIEPSAIVEVGSKRVLAFDIDRIQDIGRLVADRKHQVTQRRSEQLRKWHADRRTPK